MRFSVLANLALAIAAALAAGCGSSQLISPQSLEQKIAQVKMGETTSSEVEAIFGSQHGSDNQRWFYNLSDSSFEISERKTGALSGVFPVAPATVPTNTRAVITFRFAGSGKVSAFEVERFFAPPFINDYRYLTGDTGQSVMESVIRAGAANDLRLQESGNSRESFALTDGVTNARILVRLENRTLHIASNIPYDRLSAEYRVFTRKERAFINAVSAAVLMR